MDEPCLGSTYEERRGTRTRLDEFAAVLLLSALAQIKLSSKHAANTGLHYDYCYCYYYYYYFVLGNEARCLGAKILLVLGANLASLAPLAPARLARLAPPGGASVALSSGASGSETKLSRQSCTPPPPAPNKKTEPTTISKMNGTFLVAYRASFPSTLYYCYCYYYYDYFCYYYYYCYCYCY